MTNADSKAKRTMPKGGRKGGSVFPRVALSEALTYAKKLVSKTHVGPQSADIIHSGVVGAKGGIGDVRMSALKQFGFLEGDKRAGFRASEDAKKIVSAPPEDLRQLQQQAALRPKVFKTIFDTYHGDIVSRAKLKQRAADLKVHPDETETCIETYIKSLELAGLVAVDGDQISHIAANSISTDAASAVLNGINEDESNEDEVAGESNQSGTSPSLAGKSSAEEETAARPRAVFNVNVTLDSSLDTEKLQKQLELLKRYGAI